LETLGYAEDLFCRDKDMQAFDKRNLMSIDELGHYSYSYDMRTEGICTVLTARFEKYYDSVDTVIDGNTIDFLTSVLSKAMMFAAVAFGWFIGGLLTHELIVDIC
jgi:hypothetical protein